MKVFKRVLAIIILMVITTAIFFACFNRKKVEQNVAGILNNRENEMYVTWADARLWGTCFLFK